MPFVHQADLKKSLPFRQQPINRTNLIFFGTILLKAINKLIVKKPLVPLIWTALILRRAET